MGVKNEEPISFLCFFSPDLFGFRLCSCYFKRFKGELRPLSHIETSPWGSSAYNGKSVIWGGDIIQTTNQQDGTRQIEVFQRPLGWGEEPKGTLASEGRFLIVADKYLDPYIFKTGRKITVAGEIQGEQIRPLGKMDYRYPVLLSKQIYLWENYYYYPYPYYYWPLWGYPYRGWGYSFYYRH